MANKRVATGVKKTPIWVKFLQISFDCISDESKSAKDPMDQKSIHKEAKNSWIAPFLSRIFQMVMVTTIIITMERKLMKMMGKEIIRCSSKGWATLPWG
jgi:hypothetical protein